jgi:hypothetical protein
MKNVYFVVKTEYCNGFPYNEIAGENMTKSDAQVLMQSALKEALMHYGDAIDFVEERKTDTEYFGGDHKGNGVAVRVLNEEEVVLVIKTAVDNSDTKCSFKHYGDTIYDIEIPALNFYNLCPGYVDEDGDRYIPQNIIRRPYDAENKDDDEYVYDVVFDLYSQGKDDDVSKYVMSLDEISLESLVQIYDEIN